MGAPLEFLPPTPCLYEDRLRKVVGLRGIVQKQTRSSVNAFPIFMNHLFKFQHVESLIFTIH